LLFISPYNIFICSTFSEEFLEVLENKRKEGMAFGKRDQETTQEDEKAQAQETSGSQPTQEEVVIE
jgi:hypothetical protein